MCEVLYDWIVSGSTCFETDIPDGGSGRRPGASVVSSASMSVLHSSSLRDYTPASRSENQDSLQVAFVGSLIVPVFALSLFSLTSYFYFIALFLPFIKNLCFRDVLQEKIPKCQLS